MIGSINNNFWYRVSEMVLLDIWENTKLFSSISTFSDFNYLLFNVMFHQDIGGYDSALITFLIEAQNKWETNDKNTPVLIFNLFC